jgi:drug/metabolite transporter (DMT)-like permease
LSGTPKDLKTPGARAQGRQLHWAAVLALVVVPLVWGYNWVVMKSAMRYAGAFEFAALRFVPAGLLLLGFMAMARRPLSPRPLGGILWVGLLQTAGNVGFSQLALRTGPAGRTSLLCYTMPFWVVLLGWPFLRERPGRLQLMALLLAGVGLGLVFLAGAGAGGNVSAAVLAVLSGLSWAGGTVLTRRLLVKARADAMGLAAWQMLFGGLVLWAAAAAFPGRPTEWSPYLVFAVLYEVLPATAVAWVLWTVLLKHVDAGIASLAILAAPLLGLVSSLVQLGERPRGTEVAGMGLLFLALLLVGPLAVRQASQARG